MVDPIEVLIQNIVDPKLDTLTIMIAVIGTVLFFLWMITNFLRNKRLQIILFTIHEKIRMFIETKKIKTV